jgi:predicted extracellular nuclease
MRTIGVLSVVLYLATGALAADAPPASGPLPGLFLSVSDFSRGEGDAGTTAFTFNVLLTEPAGPNGVSFDAFTQLGTATPGKDYVAQTFALQFIPPGSQFLSLIVPVNGDTIDEPDETFLLTVTNVVGAAVINASGVGRIVNDDFAATPIHDVQGNGATSPLADQNVTVSGIVTGVRGTGFYLQQPEAEYDADPATSEGVFVFTETEPPAQIAMVGNRVKVTATVREIGPAGEDPLAPPVTQLFPTTVSEMLSPGNPLPAPVVLDGGLNPPTGPVDQLERFEGMRVAVPSLTVVGPTLGTVGETSGNAFSNGDFFGVITGQARPFREAGIRANDPPPPGSGVTIPPVPRFDANPERLRVDSNALLFNPPIDVATGAVVTGLVGPLDFASRTYTILPDAPGVSPAPVVTGGMVPVAVGDPTGLEFTVASFNLQRFYDAVDDPGTLEPVLTPAAFARRLSKASLAIRNFAKAPDILGVVEVENLATLQALATKIGADAVAASQADPLYEALLVEGNDALGLDVGFLVKRQTVDGSTPRVAVGAVGQENAGELFDNPDGSTEPLYERPTLRLAATVNNGNAASFDLTVLVSQPAALDGIDSLAPGGNGWPTRGARVRAKRRAQAESLARIVELRQNGNPNERLVLVGDFNAFEFNDGYVDPLGTISGTPTAAAQVVLASPDLVTPDLTNLRPAAAAERYSSVSGGSAQSLAHVLVNAALVDAVDAMRTEHARIGADFPETARNDATSVLRVSDRDPIVAFFRVPTFPVALSGFSVE